jgi:hypothetical protein
VLPWWIRVTLVPSACTPTALQEAYRTGGGDLLETATQLAEILTSTPPSFSSATLDSLVAVQLSAKRGGDHVIVVPHSQGNLFEIQSLAVLANQGNAPSDTDAACVGIVPTASPTSSGYPASALRMRPVQVDRDIILVLPPFVPKFSATATSLSQSFDGDFAAARGQAPGLSSPFALAKVTNDAIFLHGFTASYLATQGARASLQQSLADIYSNCEISMTVNGALPLKVGTTEALTASVFGAGGQSLNPLTPISWESSDTAVAYVSTSGNATGRSAGIVRITASYRNQHADTFIEVYNSTPDASLTVSAHNTSFDIAPFWLANSTQAWRRRDVTVSVTPNDSVTIVEQVNIYGYDIYNNFFNAIPVLQPSNANGSRTFEALALFYDNPRSSTNVPIRFQPGGRLWKMKSELLVRIVTLLEGRAAVHWVRVPLTP